MIFKTQNPGDQSLQWTYKQWIPRAAAILLGVIFLLVGLSHLQQPSLQGGGIYFGRDEVIILKNQQGIEAHILTLGAVVQRVLVPDNKAVLGDVVLGFDDLEPYQDGTSPYFGALVGRVANRIADAAFKLDGQSYSLSVNDPPNSLHGGVWGFNRQSWTLVWSGVNDDGHQAVKLGYTSDDKQEGFPGKVKAKVTYTLTESAMLLIDFEAQSDAATAINLAQHTYFNLDGVEEAGQILDHIIEINSTYVTPVDETRIPTGEFMAVENTPFDFRKPQKIGHSIQDVPGPSPPGYDINYVLWGRDESAVMEETKNCTAFTKRERAVRVYSEKSGRVLEVFTNSPGLQFYSGNQLDGSLSGKGGVHYQQYGGFALETQMFPNFVNEPRFPDCILRPGEVYQTAEAWKFSILE